jgi:hypothetical protein
MVDPQPVDSAPRDQREDQPVRLGEQLGLLDTQRGEVVDIEEAAIVDLVRGDAPIGEPVGLSVEQPVARPKTRRSAGSAGPR